MSEDKAPENKQDEQQAEEQTAATEQTQTDKADSNSKKDMNFDDLGEKRRDDDLDMAPSKPSGEEAGLEAVYDIPVRVSAVLGETHMQIHQLLKLGRGAVVPLDRKVGEAIDIYVNDRLVARGEVVIMDDKLGVTMTEIVKSAK